MAATIYFAGGEDTSFLQLVGTISFLSDPSLYRPAWARVAISIGPAAAANPPPNRVTSRKFIDKSNNLVTPANYWAHGQFAWGALGGTVTLNAQMFRILDQNGNPRLCVRGAASGAAKISTVDISGSFVDLVTTASGAVPVGGLVPASVDLEVVNTGTVVYGPRTDISFVAGSPGTINTASGDFTAAGLIAGSEFVVSGSASNNGTYTATSATSSSLVASAATLTAENDSNAISFTTTGLVALYFNASQVVVFAGNIPTNGNTTMAQAEMANISADDPLYWTEIIVSDEPTLTKGLWTNPPQAPGATQNWLPNTVGNINKVTINDTSFVSSNANNEVSNWSVGTIAPVGGWMVDAVIQEARMEVDTTGPQHAEWVVEFNGTLSAEGSATLENTFGNFSYTWSQNPITSADWAITDITANTLDLGVESLV